MLLQICQSVAETHPESGFLIIIIVNISSIVTKVSSW